MGDDDAPVRPRRSEKTVEDLDREAEYLKEWRKRLDSTEQIAHIGSLEWYVKTGNMIWSDELYRILGYEPGTLKPTYREFTGCIHPEDSGKFSRDIRKIFSREIPPDLEFRISRPDTTIRSVHFRGVVFDDGQGQPLRINGSVQDITDRREIEKRLEIQYEECRKLAAALDNMEDIVIITDHSGFIGYANSAAGKNMGYQPAEMRGKHISGFQAPESGFALAKEVFIDDPKRTWSGTLVLINKYGTPVRTSLKSTPISIGSRVVGRAFVLRKQF